MKVAFRIGAVLVATTLWGCEGCSGTSVDDFPAQAAKVVCAKVYSCCNAGELQNNATYGPDSATCEANLRKQLTSPASIRESQAQGRVVYHGAELDECLTQYRALTCEQLKDNNTSMLAVCSAFIQPKVAIGGLCTQDNECIGGWCSSSSGGGDGACAALLGEDISCADGGVCDKGLYCEPGSKRCVLAKADGVACNANFECTTGGCNGKDPDAGTPGTCGLKGGADTTCFATNGCSGAGGGMAMPLVGLAMLALALRSKQARRI